MKSLALISFFAVSLMLVSHRASATAQTPDKIIFNGTTYALSCNPLEKFFEKFPQKRPKKTIISTGLWRGYVATFELIDSALFLRDIEVMTDGSDGKYWRSVLAEVFPDTGVTSVDWFTGILTLPQGKLVNYVHMGYGSTFERYILLEIKSGSLKRVMQMSLEEYVAFKNRQFENFKKTKEYEEKIAALRQHSKSSDEQLESFMRIFEVDYSTYLIDE